ncbi:MAG TPA: TetR/AcrR family transcriptional regulator [Bordetella sp.]
MARAVTERADVIAPLAATFRTHGFAGASLSVISKSTGLGKGSLYHFFPGGKEEMAQAVLDQVSAWFQLNVNEPLAAAGAPGARIAAMFTACEAYFRSNQLVCLFGAFALGQEQRRFTGQIRRYFDDWTIALAAALRDAGWPPAQASARALDVVAGVQGALVIARASDDPDVFAALLGRLQRGTQTALVASDAISRSSGRPRIRRGRVGPGS